ncbi:hypothetical protein HDU91_003211 [Kappamyces sp. JEL0680]|nr:hypothetical protein HDU91_003211 [Kappamyces sp. JEL0680]
MNEKGLSSVLSTASDENSIYDAEKSLKMLRGANAPFAKYNVHGYIGLDAMRDQLARKTLHAMLGPSQRLWMSEFGSGDSSGTQLLNSIIQDVNYLRPSAWVYWQVIDGGGWGLINTWLDGGGYFSNVNPNYFVYAQFTRFIRPGDLIMGANDGNSIAAYSPGDKAVKIVISYYTSQNLTIDLSRFSGFDRLALVTKTDATTSSQGARFFPYQIPFNGSSFVLPVQKGTVYSVVVKNAAVL